MNSAPTVSSGCERITTVLGGQHQTGLLYHRPPWFVQQATHAMVVVLFGDSQVFINILCKKLSHVLIYREFALAHLGLANAVQCWIMSHCIPGKIEPDSTFLLNDQAFFARSHGVGTPLCQSLNKATLLRFSKVAKTSLFLRNTVFSCNPAYSGSELGSPPGWTCLQYLGREASRSQSYQMPKPPQLA